MGKQRSKAELLRNRRSYENILKDERNGKQLRGKASIWRNDVEWGTVLLNEKASSQFMVDFFTHLKSIDVIELPKTTVEECNELFKTLNIDFMWHNGHKNSGKKDVISKSIDYLIWYNTQMFINYGSIACIYLKNHGYGAKRIARMLTNVLYIDNSFNAEMIFVLRHDLYVRKGIYLSLDDSEDTPEHEWSQTDTEM